jgi:hypothetical protein
VYHIAIYHYYKLLAPSCSFTHCVAIHFLELFVVEFIADIFIKVVMRYDIMYNSSLHN